VLTAVPRRAGRPGRDLGARLDNDVYFQIGLVTLIGLAAKNAILIVEFASQRHQQGRSVYDAAMKPLACASADRHDLARLHPGRAAAGHQHRRGLGQPPFDRTGVIGGMIAATFVAILFVPLFFSLLTRKRAKQQPVDEKVGSTGS